MQTSGLSWIKKREIDLDLSKFLFFISLICFNLFILSFSHLLFIFFSFFSLLSKFFGCCRQKPIFEMRDEKMEDARDIEVWFDKEIETWKRKKMEERNEIQILVQ